MSGLLLCPRACRRDVSPRALQHGRWQACLSVPLHLTWLMLCRVVCCALLAVGEMEEALLRWQAAARRKAARARCRVGPMLLAVCALL